MKKTILILVVISLMCSFSSAQTTIPGGNVSGIWTLSGSPYLIQGAIMIPNDSTLTIESGVTVNFQDTFKLKVQGCLHAIGTVADTITFTATNITVGWRGIRFDNTPATNDTSKLIYCKLQYGKATGASPDNNGGAFYFNNFSKAIVSNCRISNNSAPYSYCSGGGIYCFSSSPTITNNTISNNSANTGGGIYCSGGSPTITNNTISYNSVSGDGGGIYCFYYSSPTITNNMISYNSADWGGGIFCSTSSSPTITNNTISNNSANDVSGGGIYCYTSSPTITNNTISNNSANTGGGIFCSDGSPTITNNTISNNSAASGGGIFCCDSSTITNNTIFNNSAASGGGICCYNSSPTITNNTISNNMASDGGGIVCTNNSSPTLYNCIFWGNTANTSGAQVFLNTDDSDPNFYYCDVQGGMAAFGLNGTTYTGTYQNNIDADPLFVALPDNLSLQAGSPCIDAGTPVTTGLNLPATDLAGNPRIIGGRIDIGAYEYQGTGSIYSVNNPDVLLIYPNPVTDYIFIETPQKSEIEILNIQGQIIKTINNDGAEITIDLSNLSSGVYIIKAKTEKGIAIQKFVKK